MKTNGNENRCLACEKPMRYNVPRLGPAGGFVHSGSGSFLCSAKNDEVSDLCVQLALCPCGEVPTKLLLSEGSTFRWAYVGGDCCGDWEIEFRTDGHPVDAPECYEVAVLYWNQAKRSKI